MSKRVHYQVIAGTKTHKIINDFCKEKIRINNSWKNFLTEAGGNLAYCNGRLLGITMDDPDLSLWHSPASLPNGCYKPKRIKGNEWYKKFTQLETEPSGIDLAKQLGISLFFNNGVIQTPSFHTESDILILSLLSSMQPPTDVIAVLEQENNNE